MRHVIYEDPETHKFALIRLPAKFVQGEKLPIPAITRWFSTHEEAIASLSNLLNEDE